MAGETERGGETERLVVFCSLFVTCFFSWEKSDLQQNPPPVMRFWGGLEQIPSFSMNFVDSWRAEHAELEVQNGITETFQNHHHSKVHVDLDQWRSNGDPSIFISYHLLAVFFLPSRCCLMGFCPGITGCNSEKGRSRVQTV